MPKLVVFGYGNNPPTSADMLAQFLQMHAFQYQDRLIIVSGFDGENTHTNWERVRNQIMKDIVAKAQGYGMTVAFDGQNANADLIFVNIHNLERIYAMVYARIRQRLLDFPLDIRIGSMGDGHPQIMVAMTDACLQFPDMTIWFAFGNTSRTITQLIDVVAPGPVPADLPRLILYNHKMAPNVFHDMHQFIEQLNVLIRNHEYDAARTSIYAKYGRLNLNRHIDAIRSNWYALTDGLRSWHNFMHGNASQHFDTLYARCNHIAPQHIINVLIRVRKHLRILHEQYVSLERLATYKADQDPQLPVMITRYKAWLQEHNLHGYELAVDKYLNALRCMEQYRYDDASVRLNSVLELLAIIRLIINYDTVTTNMREDEHNQMFNRPRSQYNNITRVSRRDLYRMIERVNKEDALWLKYIALGGNAPSNVDTPLELAVRKRHRSYLVHGNSVLNAADCFEYKDFVRQLLEAAVGHAIDFDVLQIPGVELELNFDAEGQILPVGWSFVD